ncbi:hypothetical protein PPL_04010 [Heterostelium album PN500]|uniref:Uncharacterized protein n=1 Tax=Heterostelium pallidum (strain ATCC 26659 / Pp 5 / PN500) TaxID=670386 RepID=D3B5S2_HETP5|nr:hypothetical protein PPL_04010 [Heterostelium album PN500]EFA83220.1 hypothetical protein PPL_04010 [Heterostelium album PN500]|eukprot:XP_020435337.1 hypothetical protein PPL_04010 [Heterostelium album PN500]
MSPLSIVKLLIPSKNNQDVTKISQNLIICTELLEQKGKQLKDVFLKCKQLHKDKKLKNIDFSKINCSSSPYQVANAIRLILKEYELIDSETFSWLSLSLTIMNDKLSLFVMRTILCSLPVPVFSIIEHLFAFLFRFSMLSGSSIHSISERFAKWLYHDGDITKQITRISNTISELLRNYDSCFKRCPTTGRPVSIATIFFNPQFSPSLSFESLTDTELEDNIGAAFKEIKSESIDITIANYFLKLCISNQSRAANIFSNSENHGEQTNHMDLVIRFLQNTSRFAYDPANIISGSTDSLSSLESLAQSRSNSTSSNCSIGSTLGTKFDILVDRRRFKLKISIDSKVSLIVRECINLSYHIDGHCPLEMLETAALMVDVVTDELGKLIINNLIVKESELHPIFSSMDHRNIGSIAREISDRVRSLPTYFDKLKKEASDLVMNFLQVENNEALPKLSAMQEVLEKVLNHIGEITKLWTPIIDFDRQNQPSNHLHAEVSTGYTLIDYAIREIEHTLVQNVGSNHLVSLSKLMKQLLEMSKLRLEEFESLNTPDPDDILYNGPVQSLCVRDKKLMVASIFLQLDELKQYIKQTSRILHPRSSGQLIARHSYRTNLMILLFSMVPSYRSYLGGVPVSGSSLNLNLANKRGKSGRVTSVNVPRLNTKIKSLVDGLNNYLIPS